METDIELAPILLYPRKSGFQLALDPDIKRHEDRGTDLPGQRLDIRFRLVVEVGHRQVGTEGSKGLGAPPCDRLVVGDTGHERLTALEERERGKIDHACFSWTRASACPCKTSSVWRAIINSSSVGMT